MMREWKGVVFTDIDGTFYRWSLFLRIVDVFFAEGIWPEELRLGIESKKKEWQRREGTYYDYLWKAIHAYEELLKGIPHKTFDRIARDVVVRYHKDVYRYTRAQLMGLKSQGFYIFGVSASPIEAVVPFCEAWGIHDCVATTMEVDEAGLLTGERNVVDGKVKAQKVQEVLAREAFSHLTPLDVWAFGDTTGDIPMLEAAGHVRCVNPSSDLAREAEQRGWTCAYERKDVVIVTHRGTYCKYSLDFDGNEVPITSLVE